MKKTAIVSCYFQHNYGSMLQAYATQMALDKLGIENETINISGFHSEIAKAKITYFAKACVTSDILLSKAGMAKNVIIKKFSKSQYAKLSKVRDAKFDNFSNTMFHLSSKYESKNQLREECEKRYCAVIVGSDQLWLPANIAADYYTLNFVPSSVNTVSYATSFGQSTLPKRISQKASDFLKKIRHISVREASGQQLVNALTGRNVPIVCDPTLLFTGSEWLSIQQKAPIIQGQYILCYFLGNNPPHREFVKRLKAETGYKIIALPHLDEFIKRDEDYADENLYDIDPADFLNLVRNASYVCTDSFHCSVFSILYKKEFFTFRRYSRNTKQSTNSRLDTLFDIAGITGRMLTGGEDVSKCIKIRTNYDEVHKKLEGIRSSSYEYLKTSLADEKRTDI